MRQGRYHWEGVDEVAVDGVEGPRVVVGGRADGRQVYSLDEIQRAGEQQSAQQMHIHPNQTECECY